MFAIFSKLYMIYSKCHTVPSLMHKMTLKFISSSPPTGVSDSDVTTEFSDSTLIALLDEQHLTKNQT